MTLKCARCEKPIKEGTFCDTCKSYLSSDRRVQKIWTERVFDPPDKARAQDAKRPESPPTKAPPLARPVKPESDPKSPPTPPPPPPPSEPSQYPPQYPYYQYPYYPHYPYYYPSQPPTDAGRIIAGLGIIPSYIFLGLVMVVNFIMLFWGLTYVVPYSLENEGHVAFVYPWPPYLQGIALEGQAFLGWYLFIVIIIIISIFWLIYTEGKNFLHIFIKSSKRIYPPPSKSNNSFVMIAQLFFANIFFGYFVILILVIFQIPISVPEAEPVELSDLLPQLFYSLANASVAEEFGVRILYLGLPLLFVDLVRRTPKKWYRYFTGGTFKLTPATIFFLVFSSAVFALAHSTNWGLWKTVPTFVAGLALGYLFLRKGIHTSIILHFAIDYMILYVAVTMESGDMISATLYSLFILLSIFVWFIVGMVYFGKYSIKIAEFIFIDRFGTRPKPRPEAPPAPAAVPEAVYLAPEQQPPSPAPPPSPYYQYPPPHYYPPYYHQYYYHYYQYPRP